MMRQTSSQVSPGHSSSAEDRPNPAELLLGEYMPPTARVGFGPLPISSGRRGVPITYGGDGHLLTVAPTRSGKGVGVAIPNLLHYEGAVAILDPKGEAYMVTARRRREMGQRVVKLDPFSVVDGSTDGLNPLDIFKLERAELETDAQVLGDLFARGMSGLKEPFWDLHGTGVAAALLAYAGSKEDPGKRNLLHVVELLTSDDVVYNLAVLLDNEGKKMPKLAYREIASFLQMPDVTRGGVLATVQSYLKAFVSAGVGRSLEASTFPLQELVDGAPVTIYMIVPPDRLHSHRSLVKLWVGTMLKTVLSRRHRPKLRTLFLLDEVAQLEHFPLLESMVTLSAGYGAWVWMIAQDLAQLQTWYPTSWKTLVNNCQVTQAFGFNNRDMAEQWSHYFDHSPSELRRMAADEQLLSIHGRGELVCRRLNYLRDRSFDGLFDSNRFYVERQNGNSPVIETPGPHLDRMAASRQAASAAAVGG